MSSQLDLKPIIKTLDQSTSIVIAISKNPTHDAVAAALSLYTSLKENQKTVDIVCPTPMVVEHSRLVGLDKIKDKAGSKNLVVSFDYIQDSLEKVSYNVKGKKFNLIVQPKEGSKPLDTKNVSFSYSGMNADLIFVFDANSLDDLDHIYQENKKSFQNAYTISINRIINTPFAQTTISDKNSGSICEITYWLIEQFGFKTSSDVASNLLSGIDMSTNKFSSPNIPASSFLTAGKLIQLGAKRHKPIIRPKFPNLPSMDAPPLDPTSPLHSPLGEPMSEEKSKIITPTDEQVKDKQEDSSKPQTPKDWLEPKIYRGSTKL